MKSNQDVQQYEGFGAYSVVGEQWQLPSTKTLNPEAWRHLDPKSINDGPVSVDLTPIWW